MMKKRLYRRACTLAKIAIILLTAYAAKCSEGSSPSPATLLDTRHHKSSNRSKRKKKASSAKYVSEIATAKETQMPSLNPSQTPIYTYTVTPSYIKSKEPTVHPSTEPSNIFSIPPSALASLTPSFQSSSNPSSRNQSQFSSKTDRLGESSSPTISPSLEPTSPPSMVEESNGPSNLPSTLSKKQSESPSFKPSSVPRENSAEKPSLKPSPNPSFELSPSPSKRPSNISSETPTINPSKLPSTKPSSKPSLYPSLFPSKVPWILPSQRKSLSPSNAPSTEYPTFRPTLQHSPRPSKAPSDAPTMVPLALPSNIPSQRPSFTHSQHPSQTATQSPSPNNSNRPSIPHPSTELSISPSRNMRTFDPSNLTTTTTGPSSVSSSNIPGHATPDDSISSKSPNYLMPSNAPSVSILQSPTNTFPTFKPTIVTNQKPSYKPSSINGPSKKPSSILAKSNRPFDNPMWYEATAMPNQSIKVTNAPSSEVSGYGPSYRPTVERPMMPTTEPPPFQPSDPSLNLSFVPTDAEIRSQSPFHPNNTQSVHPTGNLQSSEFPSMGPTKDGLSPPIYPTSVVRSVNPSSSILPSLIPSSNEPIFLLSNPPSTIEIVRATQFTVTIQTPIKLSDDALSTLAVVMNDEFESAYASSIGSSANVTYSTEIVMLRKNTRRLDDFVTLLVMPLILEVTAAIVHLSAEKTPILLNHEMLNAKVKSFYSSSIYMGKIVEDLRTMESEELSGVRQIKFAAFIDNNHDTDEPSGTADIRGVKEENNEVLLASTIFLGGVLILVGGTVLFFWYGRKDYTLIIRRLFSGDYRGRHIRRLTMMIRYQKITWNKKVR